VTYRTPKQTSGYIYFHQHTPWCSPDSRPHLTSPAKHSAPVHIGAGLLSRPSTTTGATIQGFVALIPHVTSSLHARHIPCLVCRYLQTSARSVFSTRSYTLPSVFDASAVLSAFTVDASTALLLPGLDANAPQQCIITRPLLDTPSYDTPSLPRYHSSLDQHI
jgi:hypothetical protein